MTRYTSRTLCRSFFHCQPDKKIYLDVVEKLAKQYELKTPIDEVLQKAEAYALSRAGRSPRVAKQFVEYMKGMED